MSATIREGSLSIMGGFRVGFRAVGKGTPLVFLHGLTVSARAYDELLVGLADKGFRVIALDAADHGRTDSLPFGHTVADMVDITRQALDQLGVGAAVMVGHSMGGAMVAEFAAMYPERVMSAVLMDAAAGEYHHDNIRVDASPLAGLRGAQLLAGALMDVIGDGAKSLRVRGLRGHLSFCWDLRRALSGLDIVRATYALMRHDTTPLLEKMRANGVPTTVIHGTRDGIVSVVSGVVAAEAAGGALCLVKNGYHSWMISDPELGANMVATAAEYAA